MIIQSAASDGAGVKVTTTSRRSRRCVGGAGKVLCAVRLPLDRRSETVIVASPFHAFRPPPRPAASPLDDSRFRLIAAARFTARSPLDCVGLEAPTGPCCSLPEEHEPADGLRCPTTGSARVDCWSAPRMQKSAAWAETSGVRPFRSSDSDSRDARIRSSAGASGGRSIPAGRPGREGPAGTSLFVRRLSRTVVLVAASGVGHRTGNVADRGVG